jgi:hypothetical protein
LSDSVSFAGLCLYWLNFVALRGEEMRLLWEISDFARAMNRELKFGELSRAPLRLLRLEWRGETVECEWLARRGDEWDQDLPMQLSGRNASEQALLDAIAMRDLLFDALPAVGAATLRVFRPTAEGTTHDQIIVGAVTRGEEIPRNVSSTAMRAKLLGFRFWLHDGVLEALQSEECAMSF